MILDHVVAVRNKKTIYRDGHRCIKLFNAGYSKADVLNEALNQARVEDIGLNVPRVLEVATYEGKWAIISEFIEGTTLAELMAKNPGQTEAYLEQFVDIQCEVLEKTCPLLNELKIKMNRKISQADIDSTARYELHTRLNSMPDHNHVCHGDFNPSNVIIANDGSHYVIDWSHVTQGNASADAARTYLLFCLRGDVDVAENYLDLFCTKMQTDRTYVQKWMPIVAASQSVKGNANERDFLLSWTNVVEYE